jgi:hypothetical protein
MAAPSLRSMRRDHPRLYSASPCPGAEAGSIAIGHNGGYHTLSSGDEIKPRQGLERLAQGLSSPPPLSSTASASSELHSARTGRFTGGAMERWRQAASSISPVARAPPSAASGGLEADCAGTVVPRPGSLLPLQWCLLPQARLPRTHLRAGPPCAGPAREAARCGQPFSALLPWPR